MQVGALNNMTPRAPSQKVPASVSTPTDRYIPTSADNEVAPDLKRVLEAAGKPYYDEVQDRADQARYYGDLPANYQTLSELVRRTHRERLGFDPIKHLFPWVDLRPNLRLQSIYSTQPVTTTDPIRVTKAKDFIQKVKVQGKPRLRQDGTLVEKKVNVKTDFREQAKRWGEELLKAPTNALEIAQRIALVEGYRFYNAEHSVPQYFFDHERTPKGDLHHLFACEKKANEQRGCRPYGETRHHPEDRSLGGWAPKDINRFEPDAGKGAVARAALYFLLRYPGEIGEKADEYCLEDIQTFLRWNKEDPVSLYEKHRNQAIFEIQGNRNPFIDHPEWADQIDFSAAFAAPQKPVV
ncbi:endonuclease [bacterium]|nr:endonuclease [bacterium]